MQDPRFKNQNPEGETIGQYLTGYARILANAVAEVKPDQLERAYSTIHTSLKQGRRIYVAGNGGSAAIADHLCCDWMKGTHVQGEPALRVHSLSSNSALFTALANDFGYEKSFAKQVEYHGEAGDVLILVSSSGNSPNIVEALSVGKQKKMTVIGLSGFSGGKLNELADISLYVPVKNYGICEDAHQVLMHTIAQFLARQLDGAKT